MTLGDVRAQLAACHIGERAIHDIIKRYGVKTFITCATDLIDYTERLVRAEIAGWPDGSHTFTDYLDSDGVGGPPTRIQVTLTVAGDTLTADFSGSAPQVRGALNSTLSFTASVVALCVRAVLQEDIPNTAGMFKPLNIIAPSGTVVNVEMPGASSIAGRNRFSHGRHGLRGAGRAAAGAGVGRRRRRQYAGYPWRPAPRQVALRLLRVALRHLGRPARPGRQRRPVQSS